MPRRLLLLPLTAAVLALHWLALGLVPLGGAAQRPAAPAALFHTRLLPPEEPPRAAPPAAPAPAAAQPAPAATPRPRPRPVPAPTPRPRPAAVEAPPASPAPTQEPAAMPAADSALLAAADLQPLPDAPPAGQQPAQAPTPPAASPAPAAADADGRAHPASDARAAAATAPPGDAPPAGAAPAPVRLPPPMHLEFEVSGQAKGFQYRASAELNWRHDGARYEAEQNVKAFLIGGRSQTSRGRVGPQGLQPERFGDKTRSERAAHFDYAAQRITFSANTPAAPLHEGAQDRLSVFIQLGALLAAAPGRYPAGTQLTLPTASATSSTSWTFSVEGPQVLQLPVGEIAAVRLQRVPAADKPYDQKAELWLGVDLGYLPVRIRITQANGDWADLQLASHSAL